MAPDPPVLRPSESKIWLDYELRVYDQSTNSGRILVGTTIEVVGIKNAIWWVRRQCPLWLLLLLLLSLSLSLCLLLSPVFRAKKLVQENESLSHEQVLKKARKEEREVKKGNE